MYENEQVLIAFRIYSQLSKEGEADTESMRQYIGNDVVRGLVDQFSREVDCTVIPAGDKLYLVPVAVTSPFHVSNATLKKEYLPTKAKNIDLYMMYVTILILFGEFYDSYHSQEVTRDFITLESWLEGIDSRMQALKEHDPDRLTALDAEYEYNWSQLVEKWDAIDDLRESSKQQDGRTNSRLGFLSLVQSFLQEQGLITDLGNQELTLTEKAKTIVQRYYMDAEYNRGILDFISTLEKKKEEV
ncbi:non-ribosomal peptide synthetase module [Brevibacillus nitrificans]|uniref:Non-ribosomal peptide synthetase module n=1 Tax=Brevibacillus nitrificans TaxID=651560 RepID=A0A3M8D369_9BACL|nr:DUF6063 family protein [Brevibacillus nitrificans]RNB82524.1 non-ribosomal peptide synthetase module [Brevibacillus nitrificans]